MDLLKYFKKPMTPKVETIIVDDKAFNPLEELIRSYKDKIAEKAGRIVDLELEIAQLRVENASLRAKIEPERVPEVPRTVHFYTTTALRAELERRSRLEKDNYESKKSANH